jgi:hypothetical protein
MGTGNLLTLVICILLIVVIFMAIIHVTIPIFKKIQLTSIGEKYMAIIEMNGGLTVSERNELELELSNKGFQNVNISSPLKGTIRWGDDLILTITTTYEHRYFGDLTALSQNLNIDFEDKIRNRRIEY